MTKPNEPTRRRVFISGSAEDLKMFAGGYAKSTSFRATLTLDESKIEVVAPIRVHQDDDHEGIILLNDRVYISDSFSAKDRSNFSLDTQPVVADMPDFPEQVLGWLLSPTALEGILGDLQHGYCERLAQRGDQYARNYLVKQVTRSALIALSSATLRFLAVEALLRKLGL